MENPAHRLRETNVKNRKLEVKEKRGHFLYRLFCPKGFFLRSVFYLSV